MTVQDFYAQINCDFKEVFGRLGSEERVIKFVKLFFTTGDIEALETALNQKDGNEAFEAAHRLKGNSLNIGFTNLSHITEELVEPLRPRQITDETAIKELYSKVRTEYDRIQGLANQL